jgi:hypothetical protein
MTNRTIVPALLCAAFLAACGPASPSSPPPSVRPTPTPIAAAVTTPAEAAALVIATDAQFAGAIELTPDIIGASKWWVAAPLAAGGFSVELTIGWGDCPAGCINKRVWSFSVDASGQVRLVGVSGDEVPASLPA